MTDHTKILESMAQQLATIRRDLVVLRSGLARQGFDVGKDPDKVRVDASWNPPALKRLGDMLTIMAKANPATADALQKAGFNTPVDPTTDPTLDQANDADTGDADTNSDTDPNTDADMNERDLLPSILGGDNDPTKKDPANPRDPARFADAKGDAKAPDTRDDNNHIEPQPDTPRDPDLEIIG